VEFGTHEELMALKGRYSYLYGLQTDALANDTKTNDSDKGVAEDDAAGSSIEEVPNGKPEHTSAEGQNGHVAASTKDGDICLKENRYPDTQ
jgi:hypothetical protein